MLLGNCVLKVTPIPFRKSAWNIRVTSSFMPSVSFPYALLSRPTTSFVPPYFTVDANLVVRPRATFRFTVLFSSSLMPDDLDFMRLALAEGRSSSEAGEVPIGALLVHEGTILSRSGNRTVRDKDPTAHAEM